MQQRLLSARPAFLMALAALFITSGCPGEPQAPPDLAMPDLMPPANTLDGSGGIVKVDPAQDPILGGSKFDVPPGALSSPVTFSIVSCSDLMAVGETVLGPCVEFNPDGVNLAISATLTVPYDPTLQPPNTDLVVATVGQGPRTDLNVPGATFNAAGRSASAKFSHLRVRVQVLAKPRPGPTQNVDILFVMDNSTSMGIKQQQFIGAMPQFLQGLETSGFSYHIGVVTTDVGTLPTAGPFPGSPDLRCGVNQFGDDGVLQNAPCTSRNLSCNGVGCVKPSDDFKFACIGNAGPPLQPALCPDPTFVPNDRYIAQENGINNIKTGTDPTAPAKAFQCIALVGDLGCGIESPLEAARRALDGHRSENNGFLRPDSVLAVVFLTDEDDCSVQLGKRAENNPAAMSCAASDDNALSSCFNLDYRCLARSLKCDQTMDTAGNKTNCRERANNYLEPLSNFVNFFSSLRAPNRLVLQGFVSPSILDNPTGDPGLDGKVVIDTESPGDFSTNFLNRGKQGNAACFNPSIPTTDPNGYMGQPQLRLSTTLRAFPAGNRGEGSICDVAGYPSALNTLLLNLVTLATS